MHETLSEPWHQLGADSKPRSTTHWSSRQSGVRPTRGAVPTATQSTVDEQEIRITKFGIPRGSGADHVSPPSVLTNTSAPVGDTLRRRRNASGSARGRGARTAPEQEPQPEEFAPSRCLRRRRIARTTPAEVFVAESMESPTATQVESDAHETPESIMFPLVRSTASMSVHVGAVTTIAPDGRADTAGANGHTFRRRGTGHRRQLIDAAGRLFGCPRRTAIGGGDDVAVPRQ